MSTLAQPATPRLSSRAFARHIDHTLLKPEATVVSFPLGATLPEVKAFEAQQTMEAGASVRIGQEAEQADTA